MNWRKREEHGNLFSDGETMLVAVSVYKDSKHLEKGFCYQFFIVVANIDDDGEDAVAHINSKYEDDWGWDWSDVEYYVPFKEVMEGLPCP